MANRKNNLGKYQDKASNRSVLIRSRIFKANRKLVDIKRSTTQTSVNVPSKVVLGTKSTRNHSISLKNRFQILADIEIEDDSSSVSDGSQVTVDITQPNKKSACTLKEQSKICGNSTWHSVSKLEEINSREDTEVKNSSLPQGGKVDVTNSTEVVKNVLAGNHACLRNVNVLGLNDKCADLKKCIDQQKTIFGFLPISNLKRF